MKGGGYPGGLRKRTNHCSLFIRSRSFLIPFLVRWENEDKDEMRKKSWQRVCVGV